MATLHLSGRFFRSLDRSRGLIDHNSYIWQVLLQDKYSDAVVEELQQYQRRILTLCQRVWSTVRHVLCDDSPEGHLPEELEEIEGLDTKDLLSYSFRAVHESR